MRWELFLKEGQGLLAGFAGFGVFWFLFLPSSVLSEFCEMSGFSRVKGEALTYFCSLELNSTSFCQLIEPLGWQKFWVKSAVILLMAWV